MKTENSVWERLFNGIVKENPTFVLTLGMCPTLAVTTSAVNGLGMGLSTTVVLALSNLLISALRKVIPDKVRIPAFIVIIASFVTMTQLLLQGYLPDRSQLHYPGKGGGLRFQKSRDFVFVRRHRYGTGLFPGADLYRRGAGASGRGRDLRDPRDAGGLCPVLHFHHGPGGVFRPGGPDGDPE